MSVRSVVVRLEAEVSRYTAGMGAAAASTDNVARQVVNTRRNIAENESAMKELGGTYTKIGLVTVAALGATAKASMDWESAWTGVLKTVDGTPAQLKAVEDGLRGLAKTLPSTHAEIAAVGEAAGQLGISTGGVVAFTKTMIDMGQSTNLGAEEAATSLARFMNVMGTQEKDVGRLGATLVGLGNNFATTESEIMAMSMRLAGAGKQIGISEGQVMGLAAAMSSVGIEAEAGGSAMSTTMKRIGAAIDDGGDDLDLFAKTAGVTSEQFSKAWKDDAAGALNQFVLGLDKAGQSGESVNAILTELGIKGIREADSLLRLSAAGELMGDAMTKGSKEYEAGTALVEEANKRYETTASKVEIAWNKVKDAAIDAGAVILPVLSGVMEAVGGLATGFGELPGPFQSAIVVVAGVAGAAFLMGGALLTTIPKIAATRVAMQTLNTSGSRIPGVLGKIGKAAGIATVALIAIGAAIKIGAAIWGEEALNIEKFGQALLTAGDNADSLDKVFADVKGGIDGVGDAIIRFEDFNWYDKFSLTTGDAMGITGKITKIRDSMGALDSTMAGLAQSGDFEKVGKQFSTIAAEAALSAEEQGKQVLSTGELLDLMPEYRAALEAAATAAGVQLTETELLNFALGKMPPAMVAATTGQEVMKAALDETGVSVDAVVQDMEKFLELLFATGLLTMSARDANAAYNESLANVDSTLKQIIESNGAMGATLNATATDFDLTTEAGRAANAAYQDVARKGMAEVEAMSAAGMGQAELQAKLTQTGIDLDIASGKLGITGDAAEALKLDVLGVPDGVSIDSWMDDRAKKMAEQTKAAVEAVDGTTANTYINTHYKSIISEERIANAPGGSGGLQRATGGAIYGPGTGTSDDVPVMASNGEHMLTAAEVQMMGGHDAVYRFRAGLASGAGASGGSSMAPTSAGTMYAPPRPLVMNAGGGNAEGSAIDYDRLVAAIESRPITATVRIGNKDVATANIAGRKELRLPSS